ncbi:hypothetical protein FOT55_21325 [Serratia bockelmannii]|nr:hypothetical protein FOT55_21325 [Serratia bockelmannii]
MPLFIYECCGLTGAYKKAGCRRRKATSLAGSEAVSPAGHEGTARHFNNKSLQFVVSVQKALASQSLPGPWSNRVPLPMA